MENARRENRELENKSANPPKLEWFLIGTLLGGLRWIWSNLIDATIATATTLVGRYCNCYLLRNNIQIIHRPAEGPTTAAAAVAAAAREIRGLAPQLHYD